METTTETATDFFHGRAGYSWDPATQTQDEGRRETAGLLAEAEAFARSEGWGVGWDFDLDYDDYCECGDDHGPAYVGLLVDAGGEVLACIGGVTFEGGSPWSDDYRRVVEAELALEAAYESLGRVWP